jgi:hypothetical protein
MKSLKSPLLSDHKNILHGYSTRTGGFSQGACHGNNLAFHVNDDPQNVNKNHLHFSLHLNYPLDKLVRMEQVHGNTIKIIDKDFDFAAVPICDAVITSLKNVPLMVMVADCIPILIYDPIKEVIASVHAGRAGIFSKILPQTIQKMQEHYGCRPEDIVVSFGPSIHQCCYEVGEEIKEEAEKYGYDFALKIEGKHYYLDLLAIAQKQLEALHLRKKNIEASPYCSACNTDIFYSYRAEKNSCGRFAGIIMLRAPL